MIEIEYRAASAGQFSPAQSVPPSGAQSAHSDADPGLMSTQSDGQDFLADARGPMDLLGSEASPSAALNDPRKNEVQETRWCFPRLTCWNVGSARSQTLIFTD